jgi:hypothetical protein
MISGFFLALLFVQPKRPVSQSSMMGLRGSPPVSFFPTILLLIATTDCFAQARLEGAGQVALKRIDRYIEEHMKTVFYTPAASEWPTLLGGQ